MSGTYCPHPPAPDNGPPDVESVAARRARTAARKRKERWRKIPLSVAIVALIVISCGLLGWRKRIRTPLLERTRKELTKEIAWAKYRTT